MIEPIMDATKRGVRHVDFMVVGSPRSGTTLVQRLLCEIPGVQMPPETHFFSEFVPHMIKRSSFPLGGTALSDEIGRFLRRPQSRTFTDDPAELARAVVDDLGGTCDRPFDLFEALVRRIAGAAESYGEKTPKHLLWWRPISRAAPWVRFVGVVRDPRAVTASMLGVPWVGGEIKAWGDAAHLPMAEQWNCYQRHLLRMQSVLGDSRCLVLRYEDVVADPDETRSRLARFLGRSEPSGDAHVSPDIVQDWEWWKKDALGAVTTERIAAWDESLGRKRAEQVALVSNRVMKRFGYRCATGADEIKLSAGRVSAWAGLGPGTCYRLARSRATYLRDFARIARTPL